MQSLLLFTGIILFFIAALSITNSLQRRKGNGGKRETVPPPAANPGRNGCCGAHEVCERDSLIDAFAEEAEYFDDEELDRYAHRDPAGYSAGEADEFREIFYSVLDEEKPRWIRSLRRRDIALPDQLRDEVLMIVNELRTQKMHPC
ncbi:MAG: phospholipase [Proteiniphilum sp.]|jgi:hypothetical protein|nr:phospholipase [Proteiniphilum sp.]